MRGDLWGCGASRGKENEGNRHDGREVKTQSAAAGRLSDQCGEGSNAVPGATVAE